MSAELRREETKTLLGFKLCNCPCETGTKVPGWLRQGYVNRDETPIVNAARRPHH
jgi:hypothetical protein